MKTIEETVDSFSPELRKLSLKIHGTRTIPAHDFSAQKWLHTDHPELGFEEKFVKHVPIILLALKEIIDTPTTH